MNAASSDLLVERLNALERQNRRLARVLVLVLVAGGVGLLAGARGSGDPVAFALKDADGRTRAQLQMAKNGPVLQFMNEQGNPVASVGLNQDTLCLRLVNKDARFVSGMSLEQEGVAFAYAGSGPMQTGRSAILETAGRFARE
jgi:hypothetical protein